MKAVTKKPHHRTGRRKKHLKPADYPVIASLAEQGFDERTIARAVGIGGIDTWKRILKDDAQALEAFNAGRSECHDKLAKRAFEVAMDPKHPKGPIMLMFLLKAMFGYREGERPEEPGSRVNVVVNLPAPLTPEQYARTIEHNPDKLEGPKHDK